MNKLFLTIFIILFGLTSAFATSNTPLLPSIEWQKRELENELSAKIEKKIKPILKDYNYYFNIVITTLPAQKPNFKSMSGRKVAEIKHSNKKAEPSQSDYIVFNKFALEVPSVSKINGEELKENISELEYVWNFNESMDIFNNLSDIEITFYLSDKIDETLRDGLQKIIRNINFGLTDVEPAFTFNYENLDFLDSKIAANGEKISQTIAGEKAKTMMDELARYSTAIGLIVATLILGMFALLLMNKYSELNRAGGSSASAPKEEGHDKEKDADLKSVMADQANNPKEESGFERFGQYFAKDPINASLLLKKWIKSNTTNHKKILFGLVKVSENEKLAKFFESISLAERQRWKEILNDQEAYVSDVKEVNEMISTEIIEDMIVPNAVEDKELLTMLLSLTDENAANFIQKDTKYGVYLVEILNPKNLTNIFNYLSPQKVKEAVAQSIETNIDQFNENITAFKAALLPYTATGKENSYLKKMENLITLSNSYTDKALYDALKAYGDKKLISKLARDFYPTFLIPSLNSADLGILLNNYPNASKIKLIYSFDKAAADKFLDSIQSESLKDMIQMELESIGFNKDLQEEIASNKEQIWNEFAMHARNVIRDEYNSHKPFGLKIDQWLEVSEEENQAAA